MSNEFDSAKSYQNHLTTCAEYMRMSVAMLNDRLQERQKELRGLQKRRKDKDRQEKSESEQKVETSVEELEEEVPSLTAEIEEAYRGILDQQVEIQDYKASLLAVADQIQIPEEEESAQPAEPPQRPQQRSRRRQAENEGDNDGVGEAQDDVEMEDADGAAAAAITGIAELVRKARAEKAAEYDSLDMYRKYGLNNDYITFRKALHEAQHPDDGAVLPDASTWFDKSGRPTLQRGVDDADSSMDEDEELVVQREVISLICPLSLRTMQEPYSNNRCKHTFEKNVILEFLGRGTKTCPQTGCSQVRPLSLLAPALPFAMQ